MGRKVVSNLERYRLEKKAWVDGILEKGLGKRSLTEYAWSTSKIYRMFLREHNDYSIFEINELKLMLIGLVHEWIAANRKRIIEEFKRSLSEMDEESQKKRLWQSFQTHSIGKQ